MRKKYVLLAGFGSPSPEKEKVTDFLARISGKAPSTEAVEELLGRYRQIGSSPFMRIVSEVAQEIEKRIPVFCEPVMKFTPPFIGDVVKKIRSGEFLILPLTPFSTEEDFSKELLVTLKEKGFTVSSIEDWGRKPSFAGFISRFLRGLPRESATLLFTVHSLPSKFEEYREKVFRSAEEISNLSGIRSFLIAFQSGRKGWLSPSLEEAIERIRTREVFVLPFGFFAECLETLYDLDILFIREAERKGFKVTRLPALSGITGFVDFLVSLIEERI